MNERGLSDVLPQRCAQTADLLLDNREQRLGSAACDRQQIANTKESHGARLLWQTATRLQSQDVQLALLPNRRISRITAYKISMRDIEEISACTLIDRADRVSSLEVFHGAPHLCHVNLQLLPANCSVMNIDAARHSQF